MLGTRPQRVGVFLLRWPQHHAARSTCAASSNVRSSPFGADMVCKSRNSFADALFTQGLMALLAGMLAAHQDIAKRAERSDGVDSELVRALGVAGVVEDDE